MEKDKPNKDKSMPRNSPFKSKEELLKILADLGKKFWKQGKSRKK
ncbi:hypothetical protein [Planococcus maritimus]|nr:hypothetical protein [Planococcus maritimus]